MQVSWIDPEDVAALAENLRRPPPPPEPPPQAGATDFSVFVESEMYTLRRAFVAVEVESGFASDEAPLAEEAEAEVPAAPVEVGDPPPNLTSFRERLRAIRDRAIGAGLLSGATSEQPVVPDPEPQVPRAAEDAEEEWYFEIPLGTVEDRLDAFAAWVHQYLEGGEILVVDDQGNLLWGHNAHPELIISTLMARNAASRATPVSACGAPGVFHHALGSGNVLTVIPCDTRLGMIQVAFAAAESLRQDAAERLRQALTTAMDAQG